MPVLAQLSEFLSVHDDEQLLKVIRKYSTSAKPLNVWLRLILRSDPERWYDRSAADRSAFYQKLIRWARSLGYRHSATTQSLPLNLYAKWGSTDLRRSEVLATMYVAANTSIPVPTILDFVPHPQGSLIIMTRLPGMNLAKAIYKGIVKPKVVENTIRDWLGQLRSLPTPEIPTVSGFDGGPGRCHRVQEDGDPFDPYPDIPSFQQALIRNRVEPEYHAKLNQIGRNVLNKSYKLCFAHNDIHYFNILARRGKLSGLLDFECAGWYPEYWDFVVAYYMSNGYIKWEEILCKAFPQYSEELELEKEIWKVQISPFSPWRDLPTRVEVSRG